MREPRAGEWPRRRELYQFDLRVMAGGRGQAPVARQQWRVERLGQRHIGGVIGRQIVPQIPNAGQEKIMRVALQGKIVKVSKSRAPAFAIDLTLCRIPADHLRDFDVE